MGWGSVLGSWEVSMLFLESHLDTNDVSFVEGLMVHSFNPCRSNQGVNFVMVLKPAVSV